MVNGLIDYEFQDNCVDYLFDKTTSADSKKVITVKASTGAGKTVILIKYVNFYLNNTNEKTAFIWLCPGKGNLEEQSREKMERLMPSIDSRDLPYSLLQGFNERSVTFINWELITNRKNNALKESEKKNLFDCIDEAHMLWHTTYSANSLDLKVFTATFTELYKNFCTWTIPTGRYSLFH